MKEIKVKLYRQEDGNYVELWEVINPQENNSKYYGRYTYHDVGTWYYVADPLGLCELDHVVENDIMFILCGENGDEYFRYSNAEENPLPKFKTYMKQKWNEFSKNIKHNIENMNTNFWSEVINGETTLSINQWLLTFKDPELYKKEINDMHGYDENWTSCNYSKEIGYESIAETEFEYLGHKYQFVKVTCKHDICGVEWNEFLCTDSPYVMEDIPWIKDKTYIRNYGYLGNWFDASNHGAMLDKRTARKLLENELLKIYPIEKSYRSLLYINGIYCYEKSYSDVAEALMNKDLHRKNILDLIKNLKDKTENIVFINSRENKQKMKELYPEIYGHNYCLI